jgi:hypothetical protein
VFGCVARMTDRKFAGGKILRRLLAPRWFPNVDAIPRRHCSVGEEHGGPFMQFTR